MGEENHDRVLRRMKGAYIGSAGRFKQALDRFDNSGMPMDPGPDPDRPREWNRDQIETLLDLRDAVADLIEARRDWDRQRREWRPAH